MEAFRPSPPETTSAQLRAPFRPQPRHEEKVLGVFVFKSTA